MNFCRLSRTLLLATFALCFGLTACNAQKATPNQQKLAQLKELRDSGVLSQQEYDQKVAALRTPAPAPHETATKVSMTPTVAHSLDDRAWGIPWGTIKLPTGWGFNGGVVHGNNCMVSGDNPMWTAESPDKKVALTVLPVLKAGYVSEPQSRAQMQHAGCPMLQSTRAADFLTQVILPHLHPSFKVVGTGPEPAFNAMADMFRKMNEQFSGSLQNTQMMQTRNTVDTARVVLTYDEGGSTRVEIASAELSCNETHMAGIGQMPGYYSNDCTAYQTIILHAPDDGTPVASLVTADFSKPTEKPFFIITQNPAWQQREQQVQKQQSDAIMAQGQANLQATQANIQSGQSEAAKRSAIIADAADYSRKVHNNVYQNQQRANDQVNGAYAAHMGDYNVYTNTSTGQQYQMSNQYDHTYANQNGNVGLQTNSASSPGVDWTELTPKY